MAGLTINSKAGIALGINPNGITITSTSNYPTYIVQILDKTF